MGTRGGGVRHQRGSSRCGIKADAEDERAPVGVWQENDRVRVQGLGHT
jgi:hypothetical protein